MTDLAGLLNKFPSIEGAPCPQCQTAWFYDQGRLLRCTQCSYERALYEIEEDFSQGVGETGAVITSGSKKGLEKGVAAYFNRYPTLEYGTRIFIPMDLNWVGLWHVTMRRRVSSE